MKQFKTVIFPGLLAVLLFSSPAMGQQAKVKEEKLPACCQKKLPSRFATKASYTMASSVLPVVRNADNKIIGVLSYKNILSVYSRHLDEHQQGVAISLKRRTLKILLHGRKRLSVLRSSGE